MPNIEETNINENTENSKFDEYTLQIKYNKWINSQNKLQRGCSHVTKKIFCENLDNYLNNSNWYEEDPAKVRSNIRWKGHTDY
jgi:hypothetical protein